jgi:DNA-binding MarR family transcriptional regulator
MRLGAVLNRSQLVERAMERVGIPLDRPAMTVIVTLHMAGQPLRVGEIATRMKVVGPHVTRHLHELERRGLVCRIAHPHDQRARLIELTPDGSAAADWSDDDRETFGRLLTRFVDG